MRQPIQINRSPEISFTKVARPSRARKGGCRRRKKRGSFDPKRRRRRDGGSNCASSLLCLGSHEAQEAGNPKNGNYRSIDPEHPTPRTKN